MSESNSPGIMYVFPGQGSQYVGMGSDLYREFGSAREIYQRASDRMRFDVAKLSFLGPEEVLNGTEFTQIALLTHSIACLAVFRELTGTPWTDASVVAGHSLGEYSALVAAGSLSFEDALDLVRLRGRLMSEYGRGKMAAFRLDLESIKPLADARYCGIGGCNLPDQTVVCGFEQDLEALMDDVVAHFGPKKAGRYLKTEGAFHTYLMVGAAEQFRPHLDAARVEVPRVKVLSNYTGDYHLDDPERIRASLFFQMFHPVKWMSSLQRAIADGIGCVVEFGGGIGREVPGVEQTPASRKPNLEGITRKAYLSARRNGLYLPAINLATLQQAARSVHALQRIAASPASDANAGDAWIDERLFRLYLPLYGGSGGEEALELGAVLHDLGLSSIVKIIAETRDESIRTLQSCCDREISDAEPYLEVIVGGGTGTFLHYRGDAIRRELSELRDRLGHQGYGQVRLAQQGRGQEPARMAEAETAGEK